MKILDQINDSSPSRNRFVCVARSSPSANLIVCFNGSGNKAFAQPDHLFSTRLEAFKLLEDYDAHTLWFAEEASSWYLEHEAQILDILVTYIVENRIAFVKLIGGSSGGYAALRNGLMLDRRLAEIGADVVLLTFAINPQTGFRDELIDRAKEAVASSQWDARDLGKNPILLSEEYRAAYGHRALDFIDLAGASEPKNFAAVLLNDDLNPIEKTFSDDVLNLPFVLRLPQKLRLGHAAGCERIFRSEVLWSTFDSVLPFGKIERIESVLNSLA